jgi:hypothetical protein
MNAPQAGDQQSQEAEANRARTQAQNLDRRYGKIGISAVAAAIRHRPQKQQQQQQQQQAASDTSRYHFD